jgi:GMP synthase (glutamine-hydrolysing)
MKNIIILDCGPSLSEVSQQFGFAPDWIMAILEDSECSFTWVKAYEGKTVNHSEGDAWIITGSPRSVYDELDWMLDMEEKIRDAQHHNKPVLGICFGHQLIAKSFGGRVELNPKGWELGAYPIELTDRGLKSKLFSDFNNHSVVYESHEDYVAVLPEDAVELALNNKGNQAFTIHENMYGVQFHPEFSWDIIRQYVSVRSANGVIVDDPSVPESNAGEVILRNFIGLIL